MRTRSASTDDASRPRVADTFADNAIRADHDADRRAQPRSRIPAIMLLPAMDTSNDECIYRAGIRKAFERRK